MIYYVEDDTNIRELAVYALTQSGLETRGFPRATEFFAAMEKEQPELILLDIMLPEVDGITILRQLRANPATENIPIMMLTAKGTEFDTVSGLDAGADDYLVKPFGMLELVSRVKALMRRATRPASISSDNLILGPIEVSLPAHSVSVEGRTVSLTPKEYDLLRVLLENQGKVLTRDQLLESVWDLAYIGGTRTVDVHVQTLRQKLAEECPGADAYIVTVRGVGYCAKDTVDK